MHRARLVGLLGLVLLTTVALAFPAAGEGPLAGKRICLDPGHGGSDPGATYTYGEGTLLRESDINLNVSQYLRGLLEDAGAQVMLTREDDSYLTNSDRYTAANGWGADILVSVHTNSVSDPTVDGSYALYFHADDRVLATAIQRATYRELGMGLPENHTWTDYGVSRYASGVLLKSNVPAAMAEPLFMSNHWEADQLRSPIDESGCGGCRREQIARAIYQGILDYYGVQAEPTPDPDPEPDPTPTPEPGGSAAMHIGDLDGYAGNQGRTWAASVSVLVHDANHQPVLEATVSGTWAGGYSGSSACATDSAGRCTMVSGSMDKKVTSATITVTDVVHAQLTYDSGQNHDPDGDSDGTTITITR